MGNFVVFGIVVMPPYGKIVLVQERGNFLKKMWKLAGGRPQPGNGKYEQTPEYVLMREIDDETGLVVEIDELVFEKQLINKNKIPYDFIVYSCKYYSGEPKPAAKIDRCEAFSKDKILKLISAGEVLPLHAESLKKYLKKEEDKIARHALYGD